MIVKDKEGSIKIDGKVRRDPTFPAGIMGVTFIFEPKDKLNYIKIIF